MLTYNMIALHMDICFCSALQWHQNLQATTLNSLLH